MITLLILHAELFDVDGATYWKCLLELSDGVDTWHQWGMAPGELAEEDLQAHFGALLPSLWAKAQQRQWTADIMKSLEEREVLRRLARVLLDELNILRDLHGLAPRTMQQLRQALKNRD